jgi:hypothetical protein
MKNVRKRAFLGAFSDILFYFEFRLIIDDKPYGYRQLGL